MKIKFQFAGDPPSCQKLDGTTEVMHVFTLGEARCLCGVAEIKLRQIAKAA